MGRILREATTARCAAVISAALQIAPHLISIGHKAWQSGEISASDFSPLARSLPPALLRSGVAGGLSASIMGAARTGALGSSLQQVDPTFVAAGVILISLRCSRLRSPLRAASQLAGRCSACLAGWVGPCIGNAGNDCWPGFNPNSDSGGINWKHRRRYGRPSNHWACVGEAVLGTLLRLMSRFLDWLDQDHNVAPQQLSISGWSVLDIRRTNPPSPSQA